MIDFSPVLRVEEMEVAPGVFRTHAAATFSSEFGSRTADLLVDTTNSKVDSIIAEIDDKRRGILKMHSNHKVVGFAVTSLNTAGLLDPWEYE